MGCTVLADAVIEGLLQLLTTVYVTQTGSRRSLAKSKATTGVSFDHLVGDDQQARRNVDAKRLDSLKIDDEPELGWPHDRQIGRFLAL